MKRLICFGTIFCLLIVCTFSTHGYSQSVKEKEYNQFLIKSLEDENIGIRTSAAQLLGERKVKDGVSPLIKLLKNESRYAARIVIMKALYEIGDEKTLPAIKKVAAKDKNKTVRHFATAIVIEMEKVQYAQNE